MVLHVSLVLPTQVEDSVIYKAAKPKFEQVGGDLDELRAAVEESM